MIWRSHTGLAVRTMMRTDLSVIAFLMFTLLVVALTIDLAKWLPSVQARADTTHTPFAKTLLTYVSYRSIDIVTRLLTMACVAGGFVAALLRHQRLEDVVLSAAGAGPSLRLAAVLLSGLLLGTIQWAGEAWLRPIAVAAQVQENLGDYGHRYHNRDTGTQWLVQEGIALHGTLIRGPDMHLTNVRLFGGVDTPELTHLLHAESLHPGPRPGLWTFTNATLWHLNSDRPTEQLATLTTPLPFDAMRLRWFGIDAYYMPTAVARHIATQPHAPNASDAATAVAVRRAAPVLPGIFLLLGISLASLATGPRRLSPFRLLALAAVAYLCVVSVKTFWALGIHAVLPPAATATLPAFFALAVATLIQLHHAGKLRGILPISHKRHP
ncbi:LptF/LptG family permease [Shimia marina]|uniref:Putative permeases n=1 Tax=Shimia marina TaxID=321267 RepID=A0A0P1ELB4_9RHOB|nr:LptF/LptG family permease [Shimia marina]CUH51257.1 putative permeases [Shimia marina]SFD53806.1 Lipopolysaccharide export LptBFGC system, permease protein LptF [Shimia marina]